MPIYSRQTLRQHLGQAPYLRDVTLGLQGSGQTISAGASVYFLDPVQANLLFSGDNLYGRAWVYHPATQQEFRLGSFNAPSGAFVTGQLTATTIAVGDTFEVSELLSAKEKNLALDRAISRMRLRQEVTFPSIAGAKFYPIDGVASPNALAAVLDVKVYGNPGGTLDRDPRSLQWFQLVTTATGRELRIDPPLGGSMAIAFDALIDLTLGSAEMATVNLPHEEWPLWGATAICYQAVGARAPGQEAGQFQRLQQQAAMAWDKLNNRFTPRITSRIMFEDNPQGRMQS